MKLPYLLLLGLLFFNTYGQQPKTGLQLFESKCARCHGTDGTKGRWGAINLRYSYITDAELFSTIANGRRFMPTWKNKLTAEQIHKVGLYVKSLRR